MTPESNQTEGLFKRALRLEVFTIVYNLLEAVASIIAGSFAGSIALIGFGLDSIVESLSGFVLLWRLTQHNKFSEQDEQHIEKRATIFVGITFFILSAYIGFESIRKLITTEPPDPSLPGIIIAILSLIIMPVLGWRKKRTGEDLNLRSLIADAKETFVCSFLSVALLISLITNQLFGFWQADPLVGLVIVGYLIKEGLELVRGDED